MWIMDLSMSDDARNGKLMRMVSRSAFHYGLAATALQPARSAAAIFKTVNGTPLIAPSSGETTRQAAARSHRPMEQ
jgi:hypothetical protein